MKSKLYTSSLATRVLFAVALVGFPLLVASHAQARTAGPLAAGATRASGATPNHSGMKIRNEAQLKARLLYLIEHNPKAVKVVSRGCGCVAAAAPDDQSFWGCLRNCVAPVGISPYALIMCGVACATAETGVGIIVCAVCLGVSVSVIETCALACAAYGDGGKKVGMLQEARNLRHRSAPTGGLQAKLRLQPATP